MAASTLRLMPLPLALAIVLAGCAGVQGPPQTAVQPTLAIQAALQQQNLQLDSERKPIDARWWQAFGDPLLTPLIQQALQTHPDISSAQAGVQSARAQSVIARAGLLPSLSAGASARGHQDGSSFSAGLDASWEADVFGANRLANASAAVDVQAAQAGLEDVRALLAAETARQYVNLRLGEARLAMARQTLQSRQQALQLIQLREQAGLSSGLDTAQAQLSLNQVRAQIPSLDSVITQSYSALATLTGLPVASLKTRLARSQGIPRARLQLANHIPAQALRQRPDIRAAEYRIRAAGLRVSEARANLNPAFRLGGALSLGSARLTDLLDTGNLARSLLTSISAPLFDGGRLQQQVVLRDAALQQAQASYRKALLQAVQDIANRFAELEALQRQRPLLLENLRLAQNNERLALLNY
ncbi:MAG: efflux transporter outer membrane subunit [Thiolinea sp.]